MHINETGGKRWSSLKIIKKKNTYFSVFSIQKIETYFI